MKTLPAIPALASKDVLSVAELTREEVLSLFETAASVKADVSAYSRELDGRVVLLIFEKPSLRTRVTFEAGVARLGGHPIYYDHSSSKLGERESVHDYARNLERMVDMIVCRTHAHAPLAELAREASIPVVNALCEKYHPCQALADLFTLSERVGDLRGVKLAYIGDANNVCNSLMLLSATMGMHFTAVCPKGYQPEADVLSTASRLAANAGGSVTVTSELSGIAGARAVYTDTWVSMGDEAEQLERLRVFQAYQVNTQLMARAGSTDAPAFFMHCLPATRGKEVTGEVIDSAQSLVFDQAENRMHVQNALMLTLLRGARSQPVVQVRPKATHLTHETHATA